MVGRMFARRVIIICAVALAIIVAAVLLYVNYNSGTALSIPAPNGPGKFVSVMVPPLNLTSLAKKSDLVVIGRIRHVEIVYRYRDGELQFFYNVTLAVEKVLKAADRNLTRKYIWFLAPARGEYLVTIIHPAGTSILKIRSSGITSWVTHVVHAKVFRQIRPEEIKIRNVFVPVGKCLSFTYNGKRGTIRVSELSSNYINEFRPGNRILVFLTKATNKTWPYYADVLGLSIKFDIIGDKAILTHRAAGLVQLKKPIEFKLEEVVRQISES